MNIAYLIMAVIAVVVLAYFIIAKDPVGKVSKLFVKEGSQ